MKLIDTKKVPYHEYENPQYGFYVPNECPECHIRGGKRNTSGLCRTCNERLEEERK